MVFDRYSWNARLYFVFQMYFVELACRNWCNEDFLRRNRLRPLGSGRDAGCTLSSLIPHTWSRSQWILLHVVTELKRDMTRYGRRIFYLIPKIIISNSLSGSVVDNFYRLFIQVNRLVKTRFILLLVTYLY